MQIRTNSQEIEGYFSRGIFGQWKQHNRRRHHLLPPMIIVNSCGGPASKPEDQRGEKLVWEVKGVGRHYLLGHTVSQTLFATYHRHCRCRDHHHVKIQSHPYHLDYMPYLHISGQKEKQMCFPKLTQTKIKVPLSSRSTGSVKVGHQIAFSI